MNKPLLILSSITLSLLLASCGGGSGKTGSSTGDNSSDGNSSDGNSSDGNSSDGTPSTDVLLDRTKTYPALGESITEHLRITESHQNKAQTTKYNLWDYLYSPTKVEKNITFESYESNEYTNSDIYESLSSEDIYAYSPRPPIETINSRKLTSINYTDGEASISGINYDTKTALVFNKNNELIDVKIKKEPELIHAGLQVNNRDFCSDDVSTGEIHFEATGKGFWQTGDSYKLEVNANGPAISCDSDDNASIVGHYNVGTVSTDTLTAHHSIFRLRGHDFHNVLEFTNLETSTNAGKVIIQTLTKTYMQFYTGRIAESETSCLGGAIGDDSATCTTTDEVATNVPTIPEI